MGHKLAGARDAMLAASAISFGVQIGASIVISSTTTAAAHSRQLDLKNFEDAMTFLPLSIALSAVSTLIQVVCSAGLFALALEESRGQQPKLASFWGPTLQAYAYVLPALAACVSYSAANMLAWKYFGITGTWILPMLASLFLSPYFALTVPLMVDRGWTGHKAFVEAVRLGAHNYFLLLKAVLVGWFRAISGVIALVIGLIWTQPEYQRSVVRSYMEVVGEAENV